MPGWPLERLNALLAETQAVVAVCPGPAALPGPLHHQRGGIGGESRRRRVGGYRATTGVRAGSRGLANAKEAGTGSANQNQREEENNDGSHTPPPTPPAGAGGEVELVTLEKGEFFVQPRSGPAAFQGEMGHEEGDELPRLFDL